MSSPYLLVLLYRLQVIIVIILPAFYSTNSCIRDLYYLSVLSLDPQKSVFRREMLKENISTNLHH